jgi:hypothetical protein
MMDFAHWLGADDRGTGAYSLVREDSEVGRNAARGQKTHFNRIGKAI